MSSTRFPLYRTILRIIIWDTLHIFTNISPATSLCKAGRSVHWYSLEKPSERYFLLCKFQETPNVVYHQHNPIQYQRQNTQSLNITLKFHCLILLPILKAHATILYRWLCLTFLDNHLLSRVSWHHQMGAGNSHTKKSCIGHATSTQNVNACWGKLCNQNNIYGYRYFGIYIYVYICNIYIYTSWFVWTQQTWRNIYMIQCIKTTLIILVSLTLFSTFWSDIKRGHSDGTLKGFLQGHLVPWSMTSQEKKHCSEEC